LAHSQFLNRSCDQNETYKHQHEVNLEYENYERLYTPSAKAVTSVFVQILCVHGLCRGVY